MLPSCCLILIFTNNDAKINKTDHSWIIMQYSMVIVKDKCLFNFSTLSTSSVLDHRGNECAQNISDTLPYWIPSHFFSSPNFYITCDWMHTQKAQGKLESIYYRYFKKYHITGFKWCYWKWKSCLSTKVQTWELPLLQPKFRIIKCSCRILKWQLVIGELKAINILYEKK